MHCRADRELFSNLTQALMRIPYAIVFEMNLPKHIPPHTITTYLTAQVLFPLYSSLSPSLPIQILPHHPLLAIFLPLLIALPQLMSTLLQNTLRVWPRLGPSEARKKGSGVAQQNPSTEPYAQSVRSGSPLKPL